MRARSERHRPRIQAPAKTKQRDLDMRKVLHDGGMPEKPAELMWRDYLIMLLHIAAELEQSLMVQYLYAAYSLGGDQVDGPRERQVRKWRDSILSVAKEEMGHLLTVQNVLCLVGGPISFEREDYPWDTPYYPFTFCLEPLTLKSLAKYVFAEMPMTFDDDGEDFETANAAIAELGIDPGHPVGEIYDLIIEILGNEEHILDSDFNSESYSRQACFDDWGRNYRPGSLPPHAKSTDPQPDARGTRLIVARMATRTEAIAALRDVAGQGESPHQRSDVTDEPSHFDRFADIFRELQAAQRKDPTWSPTRKVPVNPVIADPHKEIPNATHVTAEPSRTWASLFNVRYRMLLSYLSHIYSIPRLPHGEPDSVFASVIVKIFGEMYNLKTLAGILVRLPLSNRNDARRAGPTFQMPYTLVLPESDVDCWRQHRDLVCSSQELVDELLHPEKNNLADAPLDGKKYLRTLRDLDLQSIAFIDQVLIGLRPARRGRK